MPRSAIAPSTIAIVLLACLCRSLPADEKSTLATIAAEAVTLSSSDFKLPPNSQWREERIMSAPKFKLSIDLGSGKTVKGTMSLLSRQLLDIDVVGEKDLRLKFVQSNSTSDIDIGENRNRHTTTLPLDGKTVLAERGEGGRWSSRLDGRRRPTSEEGTALNALTHLWVEGIYPGRDLEIGETWTVDAKDLKNLFGADFKRPTGEFEFTLARVVEHEGQNCAKVTGRGKVTSQTKSLGNSAADGTGETPLDATMDIGIEIFHSLDLAMDLTLKMEGTLTLSNEKDAEALRYEASSPVKFTRTFRKR
ncbi:MAG: hypothetical protein ACI8XO_003084 [Verrucomicrobiales bacterium]|jgi:hypothetical protein